jgi:hypothetical protein
MRRVTKQIPRFSPPLLLMMMMRLLVVAVVVVVAAAVRLVVVDVSKSGVNGLRASHF